MDSQLQPAPVLHLSTQDISEILDELNMVRTQEFDLPEGSYERRKCNALFRERHYTLKMAGVSLYWEDRVKAYVLLSPVEIDTLVYCLNASNKDMQASTGEEERTMHDRHCQACRDKLIAARVPVKLNEAGQYEVLR